MQIIKTNSNSWLQGGTNLFQPARLRFLFCTVAIPVVTCVWSETTVVSSAAERNRRVDSRLFDRCPLDFLC